MQVIARYAILALAAFILNIAWECLHLPLYANYEALGSGRTLVLWASAGDAMYVVVIALCVALLKKDIDWFRNFYMRELVIAAIFGFMVAVFVEYKAFYLHRWSYSPLMPIVPLLHVGLSPLLQMTLLAPLSLWISSRATKKGLQSE